MVGGGRGRPLLPEILGQPAPVVFLWLSLIISRICKFSRRAPPRNPTLTKRPLSQMTHECYVHLTVSISVRITTAYIFVTVCKLPLMHIYVWRQTWPFTFSSRTGGGSSVPPTSFQLPRSTPCDVIRAGGVASPGHVTSTAKVKVKVKVGSQQPSSLSSACWKRVSWIFTTAMTS